MDIFRKKYRELHPDEQKAIAEIKDQAAALLDRIQVAAVKGADQRSMAIAQTKLQEAVFWATNGITAGDGMEASAVAAEAGVDDIKPQRDLPAILADARRMIAHPETHFGPLAAKGLISGLLDIIDASPCFAKAAARGVRSFTLVPWDRSAPMLLRTWAGMAMAHGCRKDKVNDALALAAEWDKQPEDATKWPD